MKLAYFRSRELLSCMKDQILISNAEQWTTGRVNSAIIRAIKEGIFEFVFEIVKADSQNLWTRDEKSTSIFSVAVRYRQAKIFSLIYGLDVKSAFTVCSDGFYGNTLLHLAGISAPSTSLDQIAGAALQMQRELQWFKVISLTFNFLVFIYWLYFTLKLLIIKVFKQAVTVGYKMLLWPL